MAMRTVKVLGWGTGTASITATFRGETVFSGDVELVPMNENNAGEKTSPTLFTFEIPIDLGGSFPMKVSVGKAAVTFGQIVANYTEVEFAEIYYTGPYEFADISPVDNLGARDPRSAVKIDGILQEHRPSPEFMGTWHYTVNPGSVLEHDFRIKPGSELEF